MGYSIIPQSVQVDNVTLQNSAGVLSVKNAGIDTTQLKDGAVSNTKITTDLKTKIGTVVYSGNTTVDQVITLPTGTKRVEVSVAYGGISTADNMVRFQVNGLTSNYNLKYKQLYGTTVYSGSEASQSNFNLRGTQNAENAHGLKASFWLSPTGFIHANSIGIGGNTEYGTYSFGYNSTGSQTGISSLKFTGYANYGVTIVAYGDLT